jgi:myo-inositol 2-dehydrogenase / D-chiro-inositol 1-dehydrogenase
MAGSNRRDFMKASGVAVAAGLAAPAVHAAGNEVIKVGLVGCGGRGSGAAYNILDGDKYTHIVAIGDAFEGRAAGLAKGLNNNSKYDGRIQLKDTIFTGIDAYQKVIAAGVDLVILATPPGYRPMHLEAAINAGKHVFTEKPVAVDGPGIRKVMDLVKVSKEKNLGIAAGTQRRHQKAYVETAKRVADIGEIVGGRCAWNNNGIWFNARKPGEKDFDYQMRNWYHFLWLCGDHIVEQHVHNLDVINWYMGQHPLRAIGMGGRMGGTDARPNGDPKEVGHIFDHFAIEYEYKNGVKIASYCRHYPGVGDVSEMVVGTKGTIRTSDKGFYTLNGEEIYSIEQDKRDTNPYVQEHIDLLTSIRMGKPINELQNVAESTLTAIMGRMSAYTGQMISWERALNSKEVTMPADIGFGKDLPAPVLPVPGKTKFV